MKGVVKIYGTNSQGERELILEKNNLTTVGFSENIVNFLTTPSSVKYPSPQNDNILDASNYTIQGFSTSKNKDHFLKHQHAYTTVNFFQNSDLKSTTGWDTKF